MRVVAYADRDDGNMFLFVLRCQAKLNEGIIDGNKIRLKWFSFLFTFFLLLPPPSPPPKPPTDFTHFVCLTDYTSDFTHSFVMWPLAKVVHIRRRNRNNELTWDHNKLHYNLWICALGACRAEDFFWWTNSAGRVHSELTFQNMLLSHNGRVEWRHKANSRNDANPFWGLAAVHHQRLGDARWWCGIWKSGFTALPFLGYFIMNSVSSKHHIARLHAHDLASLPLQSNPIRNLASKRRPYTISWLFFECK